MKELKMKMRGQSMVWWDKLDLIIRKYVQCIQERGRTIDTSSVVYAARRIVKMLQKLQLVEYKGPVELYRSWVRSSSKRMNFTKWKGTTTSKVGVEDFREWKDFLYEIVDMVEVEEIPFKLVLI